MSTISSSLNASPMRRSTSVERPSRERRRSTSPGRRAERDLERRPWALARLGRASTGSDPGLGSRPSPSHHFGDAEAPPVARPPRLARHAGCHPPLDRGDGHADMPGHGGGVQVRLYGLRSRLLGAPSVARGAACVRSPVVTKIVTSAGFGARKVEKCNRSAGWLK
jgi:hypothetical protein